MPPEKKIRLIRLCNAMSAAPCQRSISVGPLSLAVRTPIVVNGCFGSGGTRGGYISVEAIRRWYLSDGQIRLYPISDINLLYSRYEQKCNGPSKCMHKNNAQW